ncbi:hypothetical protein [Providencia manganoxydans]|uniref:hypothetical protein n=1 Tax=Providencia manganoxydans TaxID=2923283 RepID=UPI0032DA25CA
MIGLSAVAFSPSEPPKIDKAITSVSQKIERTLSDFDRSTTESLNKKEVKIIMELVYKRTDLARAKTDEANAMINILLHGTEDEINSLQLDDVRAPDILSVADKIEVGVQRLKYAFFIAATSPAWHPHMATLKHLESRAISSFSEYALAMRKIGELISHFLPEQDDIAFDLSEVELSLHEDAIEQPEWVKDGDDFVKWLSQIKA